MVPAAGSMLCGSLVLIPISLVVDRPWTIALSAASVAALIGLSVFSTAFAFALYFRLVRTLASEGLSRGSIISTAPG